MVPAAHFPVVTVATSGEGTAADAVVRLVDGGEVPVEITVGFLRD